MNCFFPLPKLCTLHAVLPLPLTLFCNEYKSHLCESYDLLFPLKSNRIQIAWYYSEILSIALSCCHVCVALCHYHWHYLSQTLFDYRRIHIKVFLYL